MTALVAVACAVAWGWSPLRAQESAVATLVVTVGQVPESRRIAVAPGGIVTMRHDRAVSRVEVGDPDLVSVSVGGPGFRDLVLKAGQRTGETSVHVWASDLLVAWRVLVTRSLPQTAEFIVVRGRGATPGDGAGVRGVDTSAAAKQQADHVSATVSKGGVSLEAQVRRSRSGFTVGYRMRNSGSETYRLDPVRSVVWVDGRPVQFGMVRSVDYADPMVLPPGGSESGTLVVSGAGRWMRVLFALYPDTPAGGSPVWFDVVFTGLDRLRVGGGDGDRRR